MFRGAEPLSSRWRLEMSDLAPAAYRSLEPVLSDRIERARERQAREWPAREAARRVAARRIARAVGGATALFFGVAAFACTILMFADGSRRSSEQVLAVLLCAWPAGLVAWAIARTAAGVAFGRRVHAPFGLTGDVGEDLLRLQREDSLADARALAARWQRAGAALPLAALSIIAPLTIHFVVWCLLAPHEVLDFGEWIAMSVVIVGHAHVALCVCAVVWANRLCRYETSELNVVQPSWARSLFITVGVACVPGLLLLAIPPLLVFVTGLVFVPAMYGATLRCMVRERLELET
jgi:hypothetical protein